MVSSLVSIYFESSQLGAQWKQTVWTFRLLIKDTINYLQLFIFTDVIRCSRLLIWVGYFIYLKSTRVSSIVYQSLHRSNEETNWLINKGMYVLLFDVFKHLLLRKTDILKNCRKSKFIAEKIWRIYSGKRLFWHYYLQLFFVYKTVSQISFKVFCSGDKRLLSEFFRKGGWFQGHNERFPKYLG